MRLIPVPAFQHFYISLAMRSMISDRKELRWFVMKQVSVTHLIHNKSAVGLIEIQQYYKAGLGFRAMLKEIMDEIQ